MYASCYDFEEIGVWDIKNCCDSCHTDSDYGYYMCDLDSPFPDLRGEVCCAFDIEITEEIYTMLKDKNG